MLSNITKTISHRISLNHFIHVELGQVYNDDSGREGYIGVTAVFPDCTLSYILPLCSLMFTFELVLVILANTECVIESRDKYTIFSKTIQLKTLWFLIFKSSCVRSIHG